LSTTDPETALVRVERANMATALTEMAARQPFTPAIMFPHGRDDHGNVAYTHYTYAQLDHQSDLVARGLERIGVGRGVRTALMVKPSLEFFALTFGIFKAGAVPVMIDPGIGIKSLKTCLGEAEPEAFIGIPAAHLARVVLGWSRGTIKTLVTVGRRWLWGGHTLAQVRAMGESDEPWEAAPTRADELAAIIFTSGSTGIPKGVRYMHGQFINQVKMLKDMLGIQPGEIDLPCFPLYALFDPALGMTTVVPDMDFTKPAEVDPRNIVGPIEDFGVTNMFGSPALLNTVGRWGAEHGVKLPTLRRVISNGAPVSAAVQERFCGMLADGVEVVTPYGATEALPVCTIGSGEILAETAEKTEQGAGVCVGRPVAPTELRIIRIDDDAIETWSDDLPVRQGDVGEIAVRGPTVTREYHARPAQTALAKIVDGDTFWHRMGDLGYLDEQGRVWFCGRKVHRVEAAGETLFSVPCEGIFNRHPDVFRSALVGMPSNGDVEPAICIELEASASGEGRIRDELLELGASADMTRNIRTVLFHPGFPVDIRHNAKINREELAIWAGKQRA
jgi:olefin beta-lactone synthetase